MYIPIQLDLETKGEGSENLMYMFFEDLNKKNKKYPTKSAALFVHSTDNSRKLVHEPSSFLHASFQKSYLQQLSFQLQHVQCKDDPHPSFRSY